MTVDVPVIEHRIGGRGVRRDPLTADLNPARDGEAVALVSSATPADLDDAVYAAHAALPAWAQMTAIERGEILFRAATLVLERSEGIARDLTREMGKPIGEATGEVRRAASILRYFAGMTSDSTGEIYPSAVRTTRVLTLRQPLGVVVLITPWNFPIAIPAWKIAPALAYGNTVLFKPASASPLTADHLVRALHDAGLPPGVLNVVHAPGDSVTDRWVRPEAADAVSFTGSEDVGRKVQAVATAAHLRVQLELGGKNAAIVAEDADLDLAVALIVRGAMGSAGQKCTATSRIIAVGGVHDPLVERLAERIGALHVGDPLDVQTQVGPVVDAASARRITSFVADARRAGTRVIAEASTPKGAAFVAPMLLGEDDPDASVVQREIFGPIVTVMGARDLDAGIRLHNRVAYGLSGSIFTRSMESAFRFIEASRVGVVHVNGETPGAEPHVPFGGMKASSSFSREQGKAAAEFYTQTKTIYLESLTATGLFDLA